MRDSWPMVEKVIVAALNGSLDRGRAGTKIPARVETLDGFVRVSRGPGSDDGWTDRPLVDVEAFHADQAAAWDVADNARQVLLGLSGSSSAGHLIDSVETAGAPNLVFYGSHVERYVASYRVTYRR